MKQPYKCYTYYEYRKLLFKEFSYKFRYIIYAENRQDALEQYTAIEKKYNTKPFEARVILRKEYDIKLYEGDLQELKNEMNYEDYLQMIKDRLGNNSVVELL